MGSFREVFCACLWVFVCVWLPRRQIVSDPRCSFSLFHVEHLPLHLHKGNLGWGKRILCWWDDGILEENFFFSQSVSHGDCQSLFFFLKIDQDVFFQRVFFFSCKVGVSHPTGLRSSLLTKGKNLSNKAHQYHQHQHQSQYRRLVQKKVDRKHVSSHQGKSDDLHLLAFD